MKTIKKNGRYERLDEQEARLKVTTAGWSYCPKSEWKENVRDANRKSKKED